MNIKRSVRRFAIRHLLKQKQFVNDLVEAQRVPETQKDEILYNQWVRLYHDKHAEELRAVYLDRLAELQKDITKTIYHNVGYLTVSQVSKLEDIKRQLNLVGGIQLKSTKPYDSCKTVYPKS